MIKNVYKTFLSLMVVVGLASAFVAPVSAIDLCAGSNSNSTYCQNKHEGEQKINSTMKNIVNLLLMVVGIISVIMIIVGGILFALSIGDPSKTTKARHTIIYAVVGLVVAMFSYAIVQFVFDRSTQPTPEQQNNQQDSQQN